MPEKEGYFRVVENRGVIYTVLAKFFFYIFLTLGLMKIVFGYFSTVPKNYISKTLQNERIVIGKKFALRRLLLMSVKVVLFLWMMWICVSTIYVCSQNKSIFYSAGITLKSLNTEIVKQVREANSFLVQVNSAKVTLRNSTQATDQFVIKNRLSTILRGLQSTGKKSSDLNQHILTNTILVKISM